MKLKSKILVVDDEEFNRDILSEYMENSAYEVLMAADGVEGLAMLRAHNDIDIIILDRMMPNMDGMEMLAQVKANASWKSIPVIMQTAAANSQQVREGIQAGVYYYLAKPYDQAVLLSIVRAALLNREAQEVMMSEVQNQKAMLNLMEHGSFRFRTPKETNDLSFFIASCFENAGLIVQGLNELMINAVEHGNLGITYAEKKALLTEGRLHEEIERRLALPENQHKYAILDYILEAGSHTITIRDHGPGFNWRDYLEFSVERAGDPNGRGIAVANAGVFSSIEFQGNGNVVVCRVNKS